MPKSPESVSLRKALGGTDSPGRAPLDNLVSHFVETIHKIAIIEPGGLEEIAHSVEYIGRRLRDECCADKLRGHAILANQILTIATTRIA